MTLSPNTVFIFSLIVLLLAGAISPVMCSVLYKASLSSCELTQTSIMTECSSSFSISWMAEEKSVLLIAHRYLKPRALAYASATVPSEHL